MGDFLKALMMQTESLVASLAKTTNCMQSALAR